MSRNKLSKLMSSTQALTNYHGLVLGVVNQLHGSNHFAMARMLSKGIHEAMDAGNGPGILHVDRSNPNDINPWRLGSIGVIDKRSSMLTEIDFSKVIFHSVGNTGEEGISGNAVVENTRQLGHILLDPIIGLALLDDNKENKKYSVLEWIRTRINVTQLSFFGGTVNDMEIWPYIFGVSYNGRCWGYSHLDMINTRWKTGTIIPVLPVEHFK